MSKRTILNNKKIVALSFLLVSIIILIMLFVVIQRNKIDYITVIQKPEKLIFDIGDEFEYEGLKVIAVKKNGKQFEIASHNYSIAGFDSTVANNMLEIIVSYENFLCSYFIEIKNPPVYKSKVISVTFKTLPTKLTYKIGEWIDPTGGVLLCEYKDGSTAEVELKPEMIFGFSSQELGTFTLIVKYTERGVTVKTTFDITVTE